MSKIYQFGTSPQTRSVISTKNRIWAAAAGGDQMVQVGVMASFSMNESRTVDPVRGIGFGDQIAELVPGVTEPIQISVVRTALYLSNIYQVFGYNAGTSGLVRSLKHHKFPFDIKHELIVSDLKENATAPGTRTVGYTGATQTVQALITFFEGCWMTSYQTEFSADTAIVQENVDIICTDITDSSSLADYNEFMNSGNNPSISGQRGSGIYK